MSTSQRYDLYSHDFRRSTHETYARMREESPVHRQPGLDGETPIYNRSEARHGALIAAGRERHDRLVGIMRDVRL